MTWSRTDSCHFIQVSRAPELVLQQTARATWLEQCCSKRPNYSGQVQTERVPAGHFAPRNKDVVANVRWCSQGLGIQGGQHQQTDRKALE